MVGHLERVVCAAATSVAARCVTRRDGAPSVVVARFLREASWQQVGRLAFFLSVQVMHIFSDEYALRLRLGPGVLGTFFSK